jgi:putative transposase
VIVLDSIRYCQANRGLELCAYCIMSSHIHMIIGRHGEPNLEHIIRDIKKYTSTQIIEVFKKNRRKVEKKGYYGSLRKLAKEIRTILTISFGSRIISQ